MSCFFCKNYEELHCYCKKSVMVATGSESIDCEDYEYNKELEE